MSERNQYLAIRVIWAGRIISLAAVLLLAVMLIGPTAIDDINDIPETITIEGILLGIIAGVALAGSIVSWWREWLAAVLLVFAAVALAIHIGIVAGHNHVLAWIILGLPYLIAGVLFFSSWYLSRKTI